jgi:hypothetical protein
MVKFTVVRRTVVQCAILQFTIRNEQVECELLKAKFNHYDYDTMNVRSCVRL